MSVTTGWDLGYTRGKFISKKSGDNNENEEVYLYRWGHSLISVPESDEVGDGGEYLDSLLMVGGVHKAQNSREDGRDQILVKNMPTLLISGDLSRFEIVAKSGVIPPIFGHSCRYVRGFYLVICIGGFDTASDVFLARSLYGVFIFDVHYGLWRSAVIENLKFDAGGLVPEYGIAETAMEVVRPSINIAPVVVVIGGRSQCYNCYNNYRDISRQRARGYIRYSTKIRGSMLLNVLIEPAGGVYGHCTVSDGSSIYVLFGGLPMQGAAPIMRKFQVLPSKDRYGYTVTTFENIITTSPTPPPRMYPSCFLYGKQIFVFGGIEVIQNSSSVSSTLQDSWRLDLQTLQWVRLKESPRTGPGPRWRSASAIVAPIQDTTRQARQVNNYETPKDSSVTGMIIHGGLTSGPLKEDQRFYFLRSATTGGWKGAYINENGFRATSSTPQDPGAPQREPKLSYYIQAIIVLLALIVLISAAYLLRSFFPGRKKANKTGKRNLLSRKSMTGTSISGGIETKGSSINNIDTPHIVKANQKEPLSEKSVSQSLEGIPSILSGSTPSILAGKHENRSPPGGKKLNNVINRSLSSNNMRKSRRASSMSWMHEELRSKYPEIATIAQPKLPKSLTDTNSSVNTIGIMDLSKPYAAIQSFTAQRYDEVSLTRGDLCTLRLVFKDNWAVGMNLTLRKTGIIPVACLQVEDNVYLSSNLSNAAYLETDVHEGISCSVRLDIQKPLKDLDQLLESRAITIEQYLDRRKAIFRSCVTTMQ